MTSTETLQLIVKNKSISLQRLQSEKEILLKTMKELMDNNLPYSTIGNRIKIINNTLLLIKEMPH